MIGEYLSPVDLFCLDRTCRKLRQQSSRPTDLRDIGQEPLQMHSLRARLDREHYPQLCHMETEGALFPTVAACSFCMDIHPRACFTSEQLGTTPHTRRCTSSIGDILICGDYRTSAEELRDVLSQAELRYGNDNLGPGFDTVLTEWPHRATTLLCSSLIRDVLSLDSTYTTYSLTFAGLIFTHNFVLQLKPANTFMYFDSLEDMASLQTGTGELPICPHHTVYSAASAIEEQASMNATLVESGVECRKEGCSTIFEFIVVSDNPVERTMCLKVQREFGWLESVAGKL